MRLAVQVPHQDRSERVRGAIELVPREEEELRRAFLDVIRPVKAGQLLGVRHPFLNLDTTLPYGEIAAAESVPAEPVRRIYPAAVRHKVLSPVRKHRVDGRGIGETSRE